MVEKDIYSIFDQEEEEEENNIISSSSSSVTQEDKLHSHINTNT